MYFKGVNRGMAFTKAGFYLTGLAFLAGLLAPRLRLQRVVFDLGIRPKRTGGLWRVYFRKKSCAIAACRAVWTRCRSLPGHLFRFPCMFIISRTLETRSMGWRIFIDRRKPKVPTHSQGVVDGVLRQRFASGASIRGLGSSPFSWLEEGGLEGSLSDTGHAVPVLYLVRKYKVDSIQTNVLVLPPLDLELLHVLNDEVHARALLIGTFE
jgi:hypothetical protein